MKFKLIEDWKRSWRWSSVRFAALVAALAALLTANQTLAIGLIMIIPGGGWQYLIAFAVFMVVIGIPWLLRVTKLDGGDDGAA